MSKPKKINLNQWERVKTADEMEGYQGLIIVPIALPDGTQLPNIYFRKGEFKHNEIDDVESVEWNKDIRISKEGSDDEYAERVNWWYSNALTNEEYRQLINTEFNKEGFDVKKQWNLSQNYLKKFNYSARKTYLHKYVYNWLRNEFHKYLRFKR